MVGPLSQHVEWEGFPAGPQRFMGGTASWPVRKDLWKGRLTAGPLKTETIWEGQPVRNKS